MRAAILLLLLLASCTASEVATSKCPVVYARVIARGNSMQPLIANGQELIARNGYYDCHPVQRGDLVLYNYSGSSAPVLKRVCGIPGDALALEQEGNVFRIVVNGQAVRNSAGKEYLLTPDRTRLLRLYINDYVGVIPENAYLLLGDNPSDSTDSTRFGLVDRSEIIANVAPPGS
jgi:signal peptidase I